MATEAQRRGAQDRGDEAGQRERQDEPEPGRAALDRSEPGGGVSADADEGGLAERGEAADAGEQDEAEGGERIDADIVHQRDGEASEQRRSDCDEDDREAEKHGREAPHQASPSRSSSSSSSMLCPVRMDCQISTGMSAPKTMTSLKALLTNDA